LIPRTFRKEKLGEEWLDQSGRQVAAAGGRPIRWYFAEAETAEFARELFETAGGGREKIEIIVLPWPGKKQ
jgi:hypothetical protein